MLRNLLCVAGMVFASSNGAIAQSETSNTPHQKWGESGGWAIYIDPDVGNGCYMEKTLDDGTLVQVGILPDRDGGFFAAYNAAWTNIEDGATGTVQFDFGPSLFAGEYVAVFKNDIPGGYAFFNNPEFVKEFGKRNTVSIEGNKGNALDFKLTGTLKAINAVRNCDAEQTRPE